MWRITATRKGWRTRRFVYVPPNLDGLMTVHKIARLHDGSLPSAPTAVHLRTSEPPRWFEPVHRLGSVSCSIVSSRTPSPNASIIALGFSRAWKATTDVWIFLADSNLFTTLSKEVVEGTGERRFDRRVAVPRTP